MPYTVQTTTQTIKAYALIPGSRNNTHIYAYCNDETTRQPISTSYSNETIVKVTDPDGKDITQYLKS